MKIPPFLISTLIAAALLALSLGAGASPSTERVATPALPDYELGADLSRPGLRMFEYVPKGQAVNNWQDMVTVQVIERTPFHPRELYTRISEDWKRICDRAQSAYLADVPKKPPFVVAGWQLSCPKSPVTGQPEYTMFRGIQGKYNFHLVQKAFKHEPTQAEAERWAKYLNQITVCDDEEPGWMCSSLKKGK